LYGESVKIKNDIARARKIIENFINANDDEIFFTSGGSESNCWAIQGFINRCNRRGKNASIITSVVEHKSIIDCVDNMNVDVHYIGVDNEGFINMESLESVLRDLNIKSNEILVSIQFANNEIGTIQHVKDIASLVHKYGAIFHTDAVQAFGHIDIDVKDIDVDMLTASGHKIGTPKGIGILYKKNSVTIDPLIYGSQMDSMRGGTENVPYIIGMAKAVELICNDVKYQSRIIALRDYFINKLKNIGCKINGSLNERLCNNISITFSQDISGEAMVYMLDMCGIYVATGSACNSHDTEVSHVLRAIGMCDRDAHKTIRITLSDDITIDEIDKTIYELTKQITVLTTI
jgi:cysteine desulfurase